MYVLFQEYLNYFYHSNKDIKIKGGIPLKDDREKSML